MAFWAAVLLSIFLSLAQLVVPLFSMQVFNLVLPSDSLSTLLALAIISAALVAASAVVDASRTHILSGAALQVDSLCFKQILQGSPADRHAIAELLGDLDAVKTFLSGPLALAVLDLPCSVAFVGAIFLLNFLIGIIAVGACFVMLVIGGMSHYMTKTWQADLALETGLSNKLLHNILLPDDLSKTIGVRERNVSRLVRLRSRNARVSSAIQERKAWLDATSRGTRNIIQITILSCAAFVVVNHNSGAGAIVASSMLLSRALSPIERLMGSSQAFKGFLKAYRHVAQYTAIYQSPEEAFDLPAISGRAELINVSQYAPGSGKAILRKVNVAIDSGKLLVVVGREGAGKTTLARLLSGIEAPTAGEFRIDGSRVSDFDPIKLGIQIGFCPQKLDFDDGLISEFISKGEPDVDATKIIEAAKLFELHDAIQRLPEGYQTNINSRNLLLSIGQMKRLTLARAFFGAPKFIVLDEPNAHLDDNGEACLLRAVQDLKSRGTTLVITSRLPGLLHLADQLLMLDDGEIRLLANQQQMQAFLTPRLAVSGVA